MLETDSHPCGCSKPALKPELASHDGRPDVVAPRFMDSSVQGVLCRHEQEEGQEKGEEGGHQQQGGFSDSTDLEDKLRKTQFPKNLAVLKKAAAVDKVHKLKDCAVSRKVVRKVKLRLCHFYLHFCVYYPIPPLLLKKKKVKFKSNQKKKKIQK